MMAITIGRATSEDAAAMIDFLKLVGGETNYLSFGSDGLPITVEDEAAYLAGYENSQDTVMLVAKECGKLVGNATLNRLPRRMNHRGELSIAVAKSHWNRGIGSQLLDMLVKFGRESGLELLELTVRSDHARAIHLYQKFGFETVAEYESFFKIGNEYFGAKVMRLSL